MTDEHELHDVWSDDDPNPDDDLELSEDSAGLIEDMEPGEHLVSAEQFDDELARLAPDEPDEAGLNQAGSIPYAQASTEDESLEAMDDERLRGPRAQTFRRRLRDQVSMLPLALWLLALGGFLLAREQDVAGLPDFSTLALAELSVLAVATTMVVHSLLSGRRERGLLFLGLWIWVTAVIVAMLVYGIEEHPDVKEWWPLGLWSLAITLLLTYLIERTHDARLVLLSTVVLVGGTAAYAVTSGRVGQSILDQATDYWPLLLTVLGVVLLPLAFRRRNSG